MASAGGPTQTWTRARDSASSVRASALAWWREHANSAYERVVPALFAACGVLAGLLILSVVERPERVASPSTSARFVAEMLTGSWFFFSICWPLVLATAAIVCLPSGLAEQMFADPSQPTVATSKQLQELEHFEVAESHFLSGSFGLLTTPCAICLERFQLGERATRLKCKHTFHQLCLMPWVSARSATCPTCRARL